MSFEKLSAEKLATHFGVTPERAREVIADLGFLYREEALPAVVGIEGREQAISLADPRVIIAGIRRFGLAPDGSDLRDLEAALARHPHQPVEDKREATAIAALANRIEELKPFDVKLPDDAVLCERYAITVNERERSRIISGLRALAHPLEPATEAKKP